jgi:hypothetical protein
MTRLAATAPMLCLTNINTSLAQVVAVILKSSVLEIEETVL